MSGPAAVVPGPAAAMAPAGSLSPAEGRRRVRVPADAILAECAIIAAGSDTKSTATISAAGCSDGDLRPDFSDEESHGCS